MTPTGHALGRDRLVGRLENREYSRRFGGIWGISDKIMKRAATAIAKFFRYAFWPLAVSILVVLLLQPIYFLSLASLGHILSRQRIADHLSAAFDEGVLSDDGNPHRLIFKGGEQLTECILLGIGLNKAETAWQTAITGSYPMSGSTHACHGLHQAVSGAETTWQPYFRYWHGYRLVLAPLAAAFPLWLVKIINVLMIVAAGGLLWMTLRNYCGATVATIFFMTFVCLSDVLFVWRTSTHSICVAYILAGTSLFAAGLRKNWQAHSLIVMSAVLGSGFNFIDFLINPPMMLMLMAFFVLLSSRRETGLLALSVVMAWFLGYSETWAAKWVLAYLSMPASAGVVADIISNVENRTIGSFNGVDLVPLAATAKAFLRSLNRVGVIIPAITLVAMVLYSATTSRINWRRVAWLSCPVLSVLWFEALSSHTQIHVTPSSRSAAVAIAIVLSAILMAMQRRPSMPDLWAHLGMLRTKLSRFRANARSK
jgi:hypothetical protein